MKENVYITLIYKQIEGVISEGEKQTLEEWLAASKENQATADAVKLAWEQSANIKVDVPQVDLEQEFAALQSKMKKVKPIRQAKTRRLNPMWWVAACLLVLAMGYMGYTFMQTEVAPVMASVTADQRQEISLSDGSKVILKKGTTFTYAETFGSKERKVELDGEAYFDVARDEDRPFIIMTPVAKVQVLGTAFNVKAGKTDDKTEVSVTEGSVSLRAKVNNKKLVLKKGQKGILYHVNNGLQKLEATDNDHLWRTGMLAYNDVPLLIVLKEMERHFGVELSVQNKEMNKCRFTSQLALDDFDNAKTVLKSLYQFDIVQLEDGSYYLKNGRCN